MMQQLHWNSRTRVSKMKTNFLRQWGDGSNASLVARNWHHQHQTNWQRVSPVTLAIT